MICEKCSLAKIVSVVGNGITEPPYLNMVRCPFEAKYYKYQDDECKHVDEAAQAIAGRRALTVEQYFDICCSRCGKYRSTGFRKGAEFTAKGIRKFAYNEGWREINGQTLCPICVKAAQAGEGGQDAHRPD